MVRQSGWVRFALLILVVIAGGVTGAVAIAVRSPRVRLVDLVPSDTIAFLSLPSLPELAALSGLDRALREPEWKEEVDRLLDEARRGFAAAVEGAEPGDLDGLVRAVEGVDVALLDVGTEAEGGPRVEAVALVRGGLTLKDAPSWQRARRSLKEAGEIHGTTLYSARLTTLEKNVYLAMTRGGLLVGLELSTLEDVLTNLKDGLESPLSSTPLWQRSAPAAGERPLYHLVVQAQPALRAVRSAMGRDAEAGFQLQRTREVAGLDSLVGVGLWARRRGELVASGLAVHTDGTHEAYRAFRMPVAGPEALRAIPEEAVGWAVLGLGEPDQVWRRAREAFVRIEEKAGNAGEFEREQARAQEELGLDVEKDLLAPLGASLSVYVVKGEPLGEGTPPARGAVVVALRDRARLEASIDTLLAREENRELPLAVTEVEGLRVRHVKQDRGPAPAWALVEGHAILALSVQDVAAAARALRSGRTVAEAAAWKDTLDSLPQETSLAVAWDYRGYLDLLPSIPETRDLERVKTRIPEGARGGLALAFGEKDLELVAVGPVVPALDLALPQVIRARRMAVETSVISALRTVEMAEEMHRAETGRWGQLADLVESGMLDREWVEQSLTRQGYGLELRLAERGGGWAVLALPLPQAGGAGGARAFLRVDSQTLVTRDLEAARRFVPGESDLRVWEPYGSGE
ncbi:MAG: hypothetical protein HY722_08815 [Planctomycetes bacterium]|nr:hypothetical protein [Planctomycetota bacterium]